MDEEAKKGIWKIITNKVPETILLLAVIYVGVIFGGGRIYEILTASDKLNQVYVQRVTDISGLLFVALTVAFIVTSLVLYVILRRKEKKGPQALPEGKIETFIVEQDARSRDDKFNDINENVKKTYWVLGIGLTSMESRESMLRKMAENHIHIRLCMMDPDIAVENLCLSSVDNETCNLLHLREKFKNGQMKKEDIKSEFKDMPNCKDMLDIYHVLINAMHFNEYYMTDTDYKGRIQVSYKNLKRIKNSIVHKYGSASFELKVTDSFMPMSLTIADAKEEDGRMVVEFHLPFTQYKVWFEISKRDNGELFKVFADFYETVWKRASNSE